MEERELEVVRGRDGLFSRVEGLVGDAPVSVFVCAVDEGLCETETFSIVAHTGSCERTRTRSSKSGDISGRTD